MKPIYVRHVHEALDRLLPEALPGYVHWPLKLEKEERRQATLFPGSRLYGRSSPSGAVFLHFIPHRRQEDLIAEVGWSTSGRFPVALSSRVPKARPEDEFLEQDWLIDFGELFHRRYGRGHVGWEVWSCSVGIEHPDFQKIFVQEDLASVTEEEARARADRAITTCLKDIQDVAVPYLNRWLEGQRGKQGAG